MPTGKQDQTLSSRNAKIKATKLKPLKYQWQGGLVGLPSSPTVLSVILFSIQPGIHALTSSILRHQSSPVYGKRASSAKWLDICRDAKAWSTPQRSSSICFRYIRGGPVFAPSVVGVGLCLFASVSLFCRVCYMLWCVKWPHRSRKQTLVASYQCVRWINNKNISRLEDLQATKLC